MTYDEALKTLADFATHVEGMPVTFYPGRKPTFQERTAEAIRVVLSSSVPREVADNIKGSLDLAMRLYPKADELDLFDDNKMTGVRVIMGPNDRALTLAECRKVYKDIAAYTAAVGAAEEVG